MSLPFDVQLCWLRPSWSAFAALPAVASPRHLITTSFNEAILEQADVYAVLFDQVGVNAGPGHLR